MELIGKYSSLDGQFSWLNSAKRESKGIVAAGPCGSVPSGTLALRS
jgi:hypothetical protein